MSAGKREGMSLEAPSKKRTASKAAQLEEGLERIAVDVPASFYRAVKIRCVERGVSLKAYVMELIEADFAKRGGVG